MAKISTFQTFGEREPSVEEIFNRGQKLTFKSKFEENAAWFLWPELFLKFNENGGLWEVKSWPTLKNCGKQILRYSQSQLFQVQSDGATLRILNISKHI